MFKSFFLLIILVVGSVCTAATVSFSDSGKWNFNRLEREAVVGSTYLAFVEGSAKQVECSDLFKKFQEEVMDPGMEAGSYGIHGIRCDENSDLNEIHFAIQVIFEPMSQNELPKFEKFLEYIRKWNVFGADLILKKVSQIHDTNVFKAILAKENSEEIVFESLLYKHNYKTFWDFMNAVNDDIVLLTERNIEKVLDYLATVLSEDSLDKLKKDVLVKSNRVAFKHKFSFKLVDGELMEYLLCGLQFAMNCSPDNEMCM